MQGRWSHNITTSVSNRSEMMSALGEDSAAIQNRPPWRLSWLIWRSNTVKPHNDEFSLTCTSQQMKSQGRGWIKWQTNNLKLPQNIIQRAQATQKVPDPMTDGNSRIHINWVSCAHAHLMRARRPEWRKGVLLLITYWGYKTASYLTTYSLISV
jgi:hypothetical protein